ncbi:MAG: hypothetical protein HY842_05575 [Bacteroidetes bacterium]|nr:hypothetical protein [Bacteroidota bacterium]
MKIGLLRRHFYLIINHLRYVLPNDKRIFSRNMLPGGSVRLHGAGLGRLVAGGVRRRGCKHQ